MDTSDVEALDATVEAERTAAVATLRTLADQLERRTALRRARSDRGAVEETGN